MKKGECVKQAGLWIAIVVLSFAVLGQAASPKPGSSKTPSTKPATSGADTKTATDTKNATAEAEAPSGVTEDFTAWKAMPDHGKWTVVSENEVKQAGSDKDKNSGNTGFTRMVEQSGAMEYAWSVKMDTLKNGCGFYIFATDPDKGERGNAYILWYGNNGAPKVNFSVLKVVDNKFPSTVAAFPADAAAGKYNELRCRYDSDKGEFILSCNGKEVGKCTDKQPYKKGTCVSLTTCLTQGEFKDMTITKL